MWFPRQSWLLRAPAEPTASDHSLQKAGSASSAEAPVTTLDRDPVRRDVSPSVPQGIPPFRQLFRYFCEFCLSCFVVLFAFFFFLTRKRLIVSPSATILALMSHEQRILSLCSPKRAWRQFSRRRTKTTLAVSTVHSRFRNVTRHVHPCPGTGLLADLHHTSAGRRETDTERPRTHERHDGTHTHAHTLRGSSQDLKPLLNFSNQICPITLSVTS